MYCSWLVFRPGLLGLETSGGGGFTGPGTAGIPVGAAAVVVDILWQLSHLLSHQQLKVALLVKAWHPISGPNQAPAEESREAIYHSRSLHLSKDTAFPTTFRCSCGTLQSHPSHGSSTWEKCKHEPPAPRKGGGENTKDQVTFSSQQPE